MNIYEIVAKEMERLEKSVNRRGGVLKNQFNNSMLLDYLDLLKEEDKPLPNDSPFKTYDDWEDVLVKKEKSYVKQMENIEKNKYIATALKSYLDQNATSEA